MVIFRFLGQTTWDKDIYMFTQEIYAELCEVVDTRPTYIINVARGDVRSLPMAFAALSDVSLAEPDTTFGFPEVRVGGLPACVTVAMRKRISDDNIRRLITDGKAIDAREAQRIGLVDFVGDVETELSRIIFKNCKPKVTNVMYRPDCERAWAQ
ncbi:5-diene-1-carboxyl-CoA hydratase) (Dienoyl-CoA hydratase) [Durusdinium trenchii]